MGRSRINPERRATYKEIARWIVGEDRSARKHGASQNTIGEIERALVAAFLDGCEQGARPDREAGAEELTWLQIPPRSRDTLADMTLCFSTRHGRPRSAADRIERFEQGGKRRWRTVDAEGTRADHAVADGSVSPLIRLGLLVGSASGADIYGLTEQGLRLCRDYWERSDRDDPTLPRMGLR